MSCATDTRATRRRTAVAAGESLSASSIGGVPLAATWAPLYAAGVRGPVRYAAVAAAGCRVFGVVPPLPATFTSSKLELPSLMVEATEALSLPLLLLLLLWPSSSATDAAEELLESSSDAAPPLPPSLCTRSLRVGGVTAAGRVVIFGVGGGATGRARCALAVAVTVAVAVGLGLGLGLALRVVAAVAGGTGGGATRMRLR